MVRRFAIKEELRGVFRLAQEKEQSHLQVLDRVSVEKKNKQLVYIASEVWRGLMGWSYGKVNYLLSLYVRVNNIGHWRVNFKLYVYYIRNASRTCLSAEVIDDVSKEKICQ